MTFGLILTSASPYPGDDLGGVADTTTRFGVVLSRGDRTLTLSGSWRVLAGAEGFDDPEIVAVTEDLPDLYGGVDLGVTVGPRDVFLPLLLHAESGAEWEAARRDLRAVQNPLQGPVTVSVVRPDGTAREITGRASVRVDTWDVDTWSVRGWQRLGLLVNCPSPWWQTRRGVARRWTAATGVGWFGVRIDQLPLAPGETLGDEVTLPIDGDVETYPTVVVTGTAEVVTVADAVSGRSWSIDCTGLPSPVTVVTDPTASAVTDGAGVDRWDRIPAPADLWPLQPGTARIVITVTGATSGTEVDLSAPALYLAAVA